MKEHLNNLLIVSLAYITAFSLTLGFVFPLQKLLLANVPITISLQFLPHGVRILTFYSYGWKGVLYLIPAALLMTFIAAHSGVPLNTTLALVSILSCYLGYKLGTLIIPDPTTGFNKSKWKFFLLVGLLSSVANGIALSIATNSMNHLQTSLGYVIGDMAGMMLAFYALIIAFRIARQIPRADD